MLARARDGDRTVLPELKRVLDAHPSIWQRCYQLVSTTEQAWLDRIAGRDLRLSQSARRHLEAMKRDLAGPDPSPLEHILVERIAACWLGVHHAELAEAVGEGGTGGIGVTGGTAVGGKVEQLRVKRLESANRRFIAAVKALAVVRRLTAGLKIEIRHTHAPTTDVPATADAVDEVGGVAPPDLKAEVPVPGPSATDVTERLRAFVGAGMQTEAALASGAGR